MTSTAGNAASPCCTAPHSRSKWTIWVNQLPSRPSNRRGSFSNRPLGSSTFRPSTTAVSMSLTGSRFSSERHQGRSSMGFEDEVEQSRPRPYRQADVRSKLPHELTSSIVPRGTSFHCLVELEYPLIAFDPARLSCRCDFSGPLEFGAVYPDAVHDHGQPTRQRDHCLLPPSHGAENLHRPGLEPGPFRRNDQHGLGCQFRRVRAVLKAQINKTDRNDARGMAQMMRVGLYRPV